MKNSKLKIVQGVRPTSPSPWLDPDFNNDFRHEIQLAQEKSPHPRLIPDPLFAWIVANSAERLLYTAFTKFAPLLPTYGYNNEVSLWTAPPLFGAGNAVCLIMSKDREGAVRLIGGNYFTTPVAGVFEGISSAGFFAQVDSLSSDQEKISLVTDTFSKSISEANREWIYQVESQCMSFYTMPIYLLVLDGEKTFLTGGPAVVEGLKQTEFNLECFGEVTL